MKTAIVTGASGFVGSHLTERLLADGYKVLGVDNFITGRRKNMATFEKHPQFDFLEADVSDPLKLPKADWVFHFASPASPPKYVAKSIETLRVNSEGNRHLLEHCKQTGGKFFFASTSEVYGDPVVHPQPETYWGNVNPIGMRSMYDEAKRYGEAMTYAYHRSFGVDVRVIRIFNTYGPRMDPEDGRVVTNMMFQALRGKPMTIYGDGKQTRSFQYVSDLVEGCIRLTKASYNLPVNLGNPDEFTILEFAQKVQKLIGGDSKLVFETLPQDDPKQRKPDISVAKGLLNWQPLIKLDQGLQKTLEFFKTEI